MIRFDCDYLEGAHPAILQKLLETNMDQTIGYGEDPYCAAAAEKIRKVCGTPDAAVHFLVGGTQTNTTVIYSILRPHEGVLAVSTGHINCHEVNAIEGTGHKVLAIPGEDGKLTAIREVCTKYNLPLFLDGARLGYALAADGNDLTIQDIAKLCDVFYIGGTKQGALFGEAVVIPDPNFIDSFRSLIKQRGGLLAKGRLLGIQFDVLFTDDLYFKLSEHAIRLAKKIKKGFEDKGYDFMCESVTNQQFPILSYEQIERLKGEFSFDDYGPADENHRYVRFCTSWATTEENVDKLLEAI